MAPNIHTNLHIQNSDKKKILGGKEGKREEGGERRKAGIKEGEGKEGRREEKRGERKKTKKKQKKTQKYICISGSRSTHWSRFSHHRFTVPRTGSQIFSCTSAAPGHIPFIPGD